jgi:hypothetical protein
MRLIINFEETTDLAEKSFEETADFGKNNLEEMT